MGGAMRWVLAMLVVAAVCGTVEAATKQDKRISDIVSKRCSTCHGPAGQSSNALFPKLTGQNPDYLIRQLFNFKSQARKSSVMEAQVANLSASDIEHLANYFSAQRLLSEATPDQVLAEAGRNLYMRGNPDTGVSACAVCHGPKALGGYMLPRLAGQHADYIATQLRRFAGRQRATDQTLMHAVASKMTDAEILAVSYFLSGFE